MDAKQRVRAVLNREPVDRLPVDIWHTEEVGLLLREHFGATDDLDLYRRMGLDKIVWLSPVYNSPAEDVAVGSGHYEHAQRTMWGTPLKQQQAGAATYQEFGEPPLRGFDTPVALDSYAYWPDPAHFDYDGMTATAAAAARDFLVMGPWISFFEIYCQMRGLEMALMDLAINPVLVQAALDRIECCQTKMMQRFFDRAGQHLDLVFISDDMGTQNGLLMSEEMWVHFFEPRLRRWCDLIHGYGLKVFFHSDGACEPLIRRLIDCGIDVLNPIQHVCPGMDRAELKRKYGERLIFHGGVDNQQVLPFGTPAEVRQETQTCLQTLGAGGSGYIACSCHNIQPGTPVENVLAMIAAVHETAALK